MTTIRHSTLIILIFTVLAILAAVPSVIAAAITVGQMETQTVTALWEALNLHQMTGAEIMARAAVALVVTAALVFVAVIAYPLVESRTNTPTFGISAVIYCIAMALLSFRVYGETFGLVRLYETPPTPWLYGLLFYGLFIAMTGILTGRGKSNVKF